MCGEHWSQCRVCAPVEGSSPHVRGALVSSFIKTIQCGIIPACAGSTLGMGNWCRFRWDHPRMCGEHKSMAFCVGTLRGSSPHVRGALVWSCPYCGHSGIIPACAGSTRYSTTGKQGRRDHPRMCGEHLSFMAFLMVSAGSSPHVRGARHHLHKIATRHGIIPACAGSTFNASFGALQNRDHPRMCGEHAQGQWAAEVRVGLSPHVRGAHRRQPQLRQRAGIIPACAGSTVEQLFLTTVIGDHPRMCGEHTDLGKIVRVQWGSSPHVRGAPYRQAVFRHRAGIIPACAGSTAAPAR